MDELIEGTFKVGTTGNGEVVIDHSVGHVIFSVEQARDLARMLADKAHEADKERLSQQEAEAAKNAPPVDRSARVLVSGNPVPEDSSHTEIKPNGQQKDYVVLTADERHRGFVRPYRDAYKHLKCGRITTMSRAISETYARDPGFYSGTFCTSCMEHFPVGAEGQFVWYEMDGTLGPKVGT